MNLKRSLGVFFLIAWLAGQLARRPAWPPVTLLDLAVGLLLTHHFFSNITRKRCPYLKAIAFSYKHFVFILFGSWVLGLRLFSLTESLPGLLYLLRVSAYGWVVFRADVLFKPVQRWIIPAIWSFVLLGFGQYFLIPDTRFLLQYGWDEHYYRMIGTILDPNYLGVMMGAIGVFALSQSKQWLGLVSLVGLMLTFSRASWIATAVAGTWYLVPRFFKKGQSLKGLSFLAFLALISALVFLLAPKPGGEGIDLFRRTSIDQRLESWREGIDAWEQHPWFGVGFNNYAVARRSNPNHAVNAPSSSWILLLATTGAVGVGLGVVGVIRVIRKIGDKKIKGWTFWATILVLVGVHAVFNNTLFFTPLLGLLALLRSQKGPSLPG